MSLGIRNGIKPVLTRTGAGHIKVIYSSHISQAWLSAGSSVVKWRHLCISLEKFRHALRPSTRTDKTVFGFLSIPVPVYRASVSEVRHQDEIVNAVYSGIQNSTKLSSPSEPEGRRRGQQLFIVIKTWNSLTFLQEIQTGLNPGQSNPHQRINQASLIQTTA